MYKIQETDESKQDIFDLTTYYQEIGLSIKGLSRRLHEIYHCYELLECLPEMFPIHHHPKLQEFGFRKAITKHYMILYTVDHMEEIVTIHGIFNPNSNYESYFL